MATDGALLDELLVRVAKLEDQMKTLLPPVTTTQAAVPAVNVKNVFPAGGARRKKTRSRRNRRKY